MAYHGEDDQGREEAHDHVAHQLHQLVPAANGEGAWRQGPILHLYLIHLRVPPQEFPRPGVSWQLVQRVLERL